MKYQPIENYGVVGDLSTVALVSVEGSIDFMCFPHFDSPSIFGALLDHDKGGRFQIAPISQQFNCKQRYLPDTNILLTRFRAAEGVAEVSDFMPVQLLGHRHELLRRLKVVLGEMEFRMVCDPKFNYGRSGHRIEQRGQEVFFHPDCESCPDLRLACSVAPQIENGAATARFRLRAGDTAFFFLEEADPKTEPSPPTADYLSEAFKETMNYWLDWVGRCQYRGRWREMINRSALTLKLLTSVSQGSIVAAPTFGLPEHFGGQRNWDYRYAWIRDASFTLFALMRLGYTEEATGFFRWIEDRCHELQPERPMQAVYGLDGRRALPEEELQEWAGYRGSRPVRVGNGAYRQLQLDIYGELLDSVYIYDKHGTPISYDFWMQLVKLVDWVCDHWTQPDDGIWEVRGGPQPFLFSRVLCWVAIDRALRIAHQRSFPAPHERWTSARDAIYRDVYEHFWNEDLKAFVQYRGSRTVDAACLMMPLLKFISSTDPRWISTMQTVERVLVQDSLVYRYNVLEAAKDGLPDEEGTFSMCSFWYVECLARMGDMRKARFMFEKALGYANHVGLYAEQLGCRGEHLGNFPQAFTHIALISAAWYLDRKLSD